MNMTFFALCGASVMALAPHASAQTMPAVPPTAAPATISSQPSAVPATLVTGQVDNVLRTGTAVPLRMLEGLTTQGKKLKPGHRFNMEVAEAVVVNGVVVIPVGSPAVGEVIDVRNKGMWGKSGYIQVRAVSLTANGRAIRLSGQADDKGVAAGGGAAAVSALVFLPAGFFMTGTSAVIPMGAPVKAFIDEDVAFTPGTTAAPMVVPAVATVQSTAPAAVD